MQKSYIAIDLKSFYASVECTERNLDAMTTNLVVADTSRTSKTICLAVSPSLKAYGIPGRARLFEVEQVVKRVNQERLQKAIQLKKAVISKDTNGKTIYDFCGSSSNKMELEQNPALKLDFIAAPPQMKRYMEISTSIYNIYLRYIAPEDIHVYSIDEVFIDATAYLNTYQMTPRQLAMKLINEVLEATGITATAGIGTNLYLAKIAMDIVAKHIPADKNGVRIAELNELSYRKKLWTHEPLTDFWRVGKGIAKKLASLNIHTMGDIARCSIGGSMDYYNEDLLYKLFGVNAELLIDHAWGWEPTTIEEIKSYKPENNSIGSGQVLKRPYTYEEGRLAAREMIDLLSLDLVEKGLVTNQIVMTVGYDIENLADPDRMKQYHGPITKDHYGRKVPKSAHGTINIERYSSSTRLLTEKVLELYDRIINKDLLIRRMYLTACKVIPEAEAVKEPLYEQLDLFTDYAALKEKREKEAKEESKEKNLQQAMLKIKNKYGKNAILKGMNLQEGATTIERNQQVGGHKA
ncbi:MAG: DNA methylase [Eubacteriales bacterium]|nr:DNA methylase [Eubacteriales bacterium]